MVKRRQIVVTALAAGAIPASFQLRAQQSKVYRIGFLGNPTAALEANLVEPFRAGLRDLGYVEGRADSLIRRPANFVVRPRQP